MNSFKKFKKAANNDDDIIVIDSPRLSSEISNELCQHADETTNETCREYYSVLCMHCNLFLCYIHVENHRLLLLNERDLLVNELNERIDRLDQLIGHPDRIQKFVIEKMEQQYQQKFSFLQQIAMEKSLDLQNIVSQLKELFQPIRLLFEQNHSISVFQIKKIQQSFRQFDENQSLLFNNLLNSLPIQPIQSFDLFHLSKLDHPSREYQLPVQRSHLHEMAACEDLLIINDREQILLFRLIDSFEEDFIPESIPWKNQLDGKILDLHYSSHLKLFFILTDEKFFSFDQLSRPISFNLLYRFTSLPWSSTTLADSIYFLYKYSTMIEQWIFEQTNKMIMMKKQWRLDEILVDSTHDQHLRAIRTNPSQTQLAILIEDDECRWRIALFDVNMICLHQTNILPNASTIDWNLSLLFISNEQLLVTDTTNEITYLITVDQTNSSIEYKHFSNCCYPLNACMIMNSIYRQLIVKMNRPTMLKFFQI